MAEARQQLIIHSGAYKTATSAVQIILNRNAAVLGNAHGILVPRTFSRPLQGVEGDGARSHNQLGDLVHRLLRKEAGAEKKLRAGLKKLANEIRTSGLPRTVISTELLTVIDKPAALTIRNCLGEFDIRVVYSVRRVDEYVESLALQRLKFKDAVRKIKPPYQTPFSGLFSWAETLNDSAMHVLVYGHPSRSAAVSNVLQAFGIADTTELVNDNPLRNPSLNADGVLLRKALTRFATECGHEVSRSALREVIIRHAYALEAAWQSTLKPLVVYGKAERLSIFDATLPSHEEIARRFLSQQQADVFLARSAIEVLEEPPLPRWDQSEVLAVVDRLAEFALDDLQAMEVTTELYSLKEEVHRVRKENVDLQRRIQELESRQHVSRPRRILRLKKWT